MGYKQRFEVILTCNLTEPELAELFGAAFRYHTSARTRSVLPAPAASAASSSRAARRERETLR